MSTEEQRLPVQYSCYFSRSRAGEQFVPEHTLGYIVSGSFEISDGETSCLFRKGDVYFCRRNQLVKYTKLPEGGEFRSVSVYFDQETLRAFSMEYGYGQGIPQPIPAVLPMPEGSVLGSYMETLRAYEPVLRRKGTAALLALKQKEALLLLLQLKPELKNILFDFSEPGKIDLEAFMNRNYHFNVELKRFAYLTGRSLSTFKRDFDKIFHTTPSRWLLQRRLQEAWFLLSKQKKMASDIYLDLGFEDLSHFSFAFKKQYGMAPSAVV